MKSIKLSFFMLTVIISLLLFSSCLGSTDYTKNAESFAKLKADLDKKFGKGSFYTNINIVNDKSVGNIIVLTYTKDPASHKLEEWKKFQGFWEKSADVAIETGGADPKIFMFDLENDIDLSIVGTMLDNSRKHLTTEKDIKNPFIRSIGLSAPKNKHKSEMTVFIELFPENGGTDFNYSYDLKGNLVNFYY